jgi:flavin reductase (DIM6/NTAB) family NADH-FMN oxidoreductase RutF
MPDTPRPFDQRNYRDALGSYPTGVTVVAARDRRGRPVGITVNSFTSVSLEPPLVLWSIARSSANFADFAEASHFSVNVLAEDQVEISQRFARAGGDKFTGLRYTEGLAQIPLIPGSLAQLECATEARHDGGDHVIIIGRVLRIAWRDGEPLVFHRGRYRIAADHESADPTLEDV